MNVVVAEFTRQNLSFCEDCDSVDDISLAEGRCNDDMSMKGLLTVLPCEICCHRRNLRTRHSKRVQSIRAFSRNGVLLRHRFLWMEVWESVCIAGCLVHQLFFYFVLSYQY